MASEIRVDKINSLSGVGTVTLSPTGVDIAGITTAATLRATTGIVTTLTATTGIVTTFEATTGNITTLRAPTGISTHFTADLISLPNSTNGSLNIGVSSAFKINHNGTDSFITEVGGGDLYIQGSDIILRDAGTLEKHIEMTQNGAVDIYHNGTKKFETSSSGVTVTGGLTATTGTFTGDVDIADTIVHTGDTNTKIRFPAADTVSVETAGSERFRFASDGVIHVNSSDSASGGRIWANSSALYLQSGNGRQTIKVSDASAGVNRTIEMTSAGNLAFPSGNGIDFSATGGGDLGGTGSSELLDDYEEGSCIFTFVPASGSYGAVYTTGHYTKIGDIVHVTGSISINGATGASGEVQISGLPFSVRGVNSTWSGEGGHGTGRWFYGGPNHFVHLVCDNSTDRMRVHKGDGTFLNHTDMNTSYNASQYSFTATYFHL